MSIQVLSLLINSAYKPSRVLRELQLDQEGRWQGHGEILKAKWEHLHVCVKKKKKKNVEKEHFDGLHFPWATSLSPGIDFSLPKECACGYNVGTKGRATGRQWRLFVPRTVWPSSAEEPAWSWSAVLICSGRAWCWSDARRTAPYSPKPNTVSDVLYIVHDWLSDLLTRSDLLASFFYSVMNLNSCLSFTKSTAPFHLYANSLILF